jgi:hypothetical protein
LCITKLNALFLVGTLKSGSDASKNSNTYALSEFLAKHLESIEVQSDFVPLANYNILPGVYTNVDNNDDWPMIFVLASYLSIPFLISLMASVTIWLA